MVWLGVVGLVVVDTGAVVVEDGADVVVVGFEVVVEVVDVDVVVEVVVAWLEQPIIKEAHINRIVTKTKTFFMDPPSLVFTH